MAAGRCALRRCNPSSTTSPAFRAHFIQQFVSRARDFHGFLDEHRWTLAFVPKIALIAACEVQLAILEKRDMRFEDMQEDHNAARCKRPEVEEFVQGIVAQDDGGVIGLLPSEGVANKWWNDSGR